ncbi:MAG: flagellar basal-body MS-ring/collar protein FliF [Pseudohongiellaceae bacterium]
MANTPISSNAMAQLNSLSQLTLVRQLGFMLILAASIALGIATVLWSRSADHTALYMGLSTQDASDVAAALDQRGLPYKIDSASGMITVPNDQVRQIRMQLASEGLPRSNSRGFDVLEEDQSLGTSNFIEQARYQRALEQELVQTIKQIQGVREARVHLSIPKQTSFIRNSRKPSASVMIDVTGTQQPGDSQLSGILHLVASSVAGLDAESVSIVDQRGNLLSQRSNSQLGNTSETIRHTRNIEQEYSNRIIDILTPIVGAGNVRAQVSANLDFTATETTEELYNPDNSVIRSEQVQEERTGVTNTVGGVAPGTLSPTPPQNQPQETPQAQPGQVQSDSSNNSRVSSTRNFEIDRSVNHIKRVPGSIQQLSVAVLVDLQAGISTTNEDGELVELDPAVAAARINRLTQLVQDAIGFSEARGDSVSVINEQFLTLEPIEAEAPPIWEEAWFGSTLKQAGASIVVILLIFGVLRPALKSVVAAAPMSNAGQLTVAGGMDVGEDQVALSGAAQEQLAQAPPVSVYDQNLNKAQQLVTAEPQRAARMIQTWINNDK